MEDTNINVNNEDIDGANNTNTETKDTFTKEEVFALIQSESDKRVTNALQTQQKKFDKQLKQTNSLVGLDAEQREKAEAEIRFNELQEQLSQYKLADAKNQIIQVLSSRGMDTNLADFIVTSDNVEECQSKIDKLDKIIKNAVKVEVEKRINSDTPKRNIGGYEGMTKADFNKLSLTEQMIIYNENPQLYKQLAN